MLPTQHALHAAPAGCIPVSLHPLAVFLSVAAGSILFGITGALFAVPVVAFFNALVRYLVDRQCKYDDDIAWEPYNYLWEIKKNARRKEPTREHVLAQLQRFRGANAKERQR
jgi:hypothetical protein